MPNTTPNDTLAELVPIAEGALSKIITIPHGDLPELRHIEKFKGMVAQSRKEQRHKRVVRRLWDVHPSVQNWFFGHSLEVLYKDEKIHIRISTAELWNIYKTLLRSQNPLMCKQLLENNGVLETLIKNIAASSKDSNAFLITLLASHPKGKSSHIHTVLQYFPHSLLQEIKTTKENLPQKSGTQLGHIEVLTLVLEGQPYPMRMEEKKIQKEKPKKGKPKKGKPKKEKPKKEKPKKEKPKKEKPKKEKPKKEKPKKEKPKEEKPKDAFLEKFEQFCKVIKQKQFEDAHEMLANDSCIKQWFFGEPIVDDAKQERRITLVELIDFVLVVLRAKHKDFYEELLLDNENLISTISSTEEGVKRIMVPLLNTLNGRFIREFLGALVIQNSDLHSVIKEQRSALVVNEGGRKENSNTKIKLNALSLVLGNETDAAMDSIVTPLKKRVPSHTNEKISPPRKRPTPASMSTTNQWKPGFWATFNGRTLKISRSPEPLSSISPEGCINPRLLHTKPANASEQPQSIHTKDAQDRRDSNDTPSSLQPEKVAESNKMDTSNHLSREDEQAWLNILM